MQDLTYCPCGSDCCICDKCRSYRGVRGKSQCLDPEYYVWCGMKVRCYNTRQKGYKNYGGRGITVCDRWRNSYAAFLHDMGPRPSPKHTIERVDNDGPYSPENCCWATWDVQFANKRQRVSRKPIT